MSDSPASAAPDDTRTRLIAVALRQFGSQGFAAASIRSIAAGAGTNVASIAYHFGSKAGLYRACAERVADLVDAIESALGTPVQTAVKREDEQAFAALNAANLMFCEDAARRVAAALRADVRVEAFDATVSHFESLHAHDAVARVSGDRRTET